ncbi:Ion-translocating oxidoreductase complex subunit B [subsurface metagenome]
MAVSTKEKIRKIHDALPKMNCGRCGFESCGKFAKAVVEGSASPFGCWQNPWAGYTISEIAGRRVPAYRYGSQSASLPQSGIGASPEALGQEIRRLSKNVDDILVRIEKLRAGG